MTKLLRRLPLKQLKHAFSIWASLTHQAGKAELLIERNTARQLREDLKQALLTQILGISDDTEYASKLSLSLAIRMVLDKVGLGCIHNSAILSSLKGIKGEMVELRDIREALTGVERVKSS